MQQHQVVAGAGGRPRNLTLSRRSQVRYALTMSLSQTDVVVRSRSVVAVVAHPAEHYPAQSRGDWLCACGCQRAAPCRMPGAAAGPRLMIHQ